MKKVILLIFIFFTAMLVRTTQAQSSYTYPEATLSSPRDTMRYFLKTMKGHKQGDDRGIQLAIKAFDLSLYDKSSRRTSGILAAKRLIMTIDKIEFIKINKIPHQTSKERWIYRQKIVELNGESHPVEISIAIGKDKKWRFTPETLSSIEYFERSLRDRSVVKGVIQLSSWDQQLKALFPAWTGQRLLIIKNGQWMALFLIIFLCFLIERVVRLYARLAILRVLKAKGIELNKKKEKRYTTPISLLTFAGCWLIIVRLLELPDSVLSTLLRAGQVTFTVGAVLAVHKVVDATSIYLENLARHSENKFDDILAPLFRKTAKFFVFVIGAIFIGDSLTLDMKSILTGLGIGGLAFALAAKDTISNLFGSLTILLDRPFKIGDWIVIDDGKIEGTIEEVGMRSTRIRTFYDSRITLPNGMLTNLHIDNYGERKYRRFSTKLGLQYDTPPEKIEAFCEGIRQIIIGHKLTRKDYFHVYFNGMGASSLDILLYVFWEVPDWSAELNERHRLLLDILRLGKNLGVQFAFPTQTLHMFREDPVPYESLPKEEDSHSWASKQAQQVLNNPIAKDAPRSDARTL